MRLQVKRILGVSFTLLGLLTTMAAIGAQFLGLDRDEGWGPARYFLLAIGFLLVVLPNIGDLIRHLTRSRNRQHENEQSGKPARGTATTHQPSLIEAGSIDTRRRDRTLSLSLLVIFCISTLTMTWLISFGRWEPWPQTTNYYHLLAEGFRAGETHLLVEPDSRLLEIENPYVVANRSDVPYLWDVSLFNGKYYLYWGPAPAILLLALEGITHSQIGDHQLVWFFALLTVLFMLLILRMFWREVFPQQSVASVVPIALAAGMINPLLWLMSRPAVYEAAVAGGQAFFVGGAFMLVPLLWRDRVNAGRVMLGSALWVLAVGSRISLVLAVLLLPIGLALFLMIRYRVMGLSGRRILVSWGYLLVPLIVGASLLAWYNYDRFGSIFELGHRYQLGRWNMHDNYNLVASMADLPINIYNYFMNLPGWLHVFPYLKPAWGEYAVPAIRYTAPANYHTEQVTGILVTSPIMALSLVPVIVWLRALWHNLDLMESERVPVPNPFTGTPFGRLYTGTVLAGLLLSIPMLAVSFISMRHELDIVPILFLCAALGFGFTWQRTLQRSGLHHLFLTAVWLAAIWTITASFLLALTGYASLFENINSELFDRLTQLFTW